jgi:hypothetical protein
VTEYSPLYPNVETISPNMMALGGGALSHEGGSPVNFISALIKKV